MSDFEIDWNRARKGTVTDAALKIWKAENLYLTKGIPIPKKLFKEYHKAMRKELSWSLID